MKNAMPNMYQVKYRNPNEKTWNYGIQDCYSKEAKKAWAKNGHLIIEDAIGPMRYLIDPTYSEVKEIKMEFRPKDEFAKFIEEEHKAAIQKHNKAKGLVGKLLTMGVGDGNAWYVITQEKPKSVKLEWRGFSLDRWHYNMLGNGGTFPKSMIKPFVNGRLNSCWRD